MIQVDASPGARRRA